VGSMGRYGIQPLRWLGDRYKIIISYVILDLQPYFKGSVFFPIQAMLISNCFSL